jgi:hypothetical protein
MRPVLRGMELERRVLRARGEGRGRDGEREREREREKEREVSDKRFRVFAYACV